MAKDIPYYFADTGINGEMLGEQNVYSLPLTNTVLTSNIFNITINKTPNSASSTYFLPYDNSELGPVSDKSGIYRNEIFQLTTPNNLFNIGVTPSIPLIISAVPTSSIINKYFLPYDNPELGSVSDKSGIYRNEIFEINNQRQYRYLVQDSTGSSYPVDSRYDQYYSYTKVISNFDVLSNLAPINLPISSSGSFIITGGPLIDTSSLVTNSVQVLVVAGGGGGGMDMGGGGGGGGVVYNPSYTITSGSVINITVGNGGAGAPAAGTGGQPGGHQYTISASQGGNSVFGSITAIGGGYGGSSYFQYTPNNGYGGNGGSGGGASGYSDGNTGRSGSGTSGQGYNGGSNGGQYYSGGGGGAGGAGSSGPNKPNGGPGLLFYFMSPYYFGGGGGGSGYSAIGGDGGIGGGGGGAVGTTYGGAGLNNGSPGGGGSINSQTNTPGGNAGANTGGGGGGGSHYNSNNKGGDGGSGIVIVRYYGSQKATGGTVTSVDGNTIHTFTGSATMSFYDNPSTNPITSGYGYFDGSGSYLRISGSSLLNLGSGSTFPSQFTVEYDFYTLSASKNQSILSRGGGSALWNSSSGLVYNAGITSSKASWEYLTNNSSSYLLTSSTTISNNTWYTFAITYDGSITRLYLNGILENYVSSSVYNYPSTLISSLTSSYIGRLVNTASYDYAGYLDKIRITTGLARYTSTSYISQSTNFPSASGFLSGSDYCNSNILTIRFVSGSITASNLIYPSGSFGFTGSQDILISNITGTLDNYLINKIGSGSNAIKRNDGITDKTVYTGDGYLNSTTIFTKGTTERVTLESSDFIFNSLSDPSKNYSYKGSGSNAIRRNDGITDKTIYTGNGYLSSTTINTIGNIDRIILQGSSVVINTNTNNFIPSVNKTFTYEVDYNFMFNQEIDSLLTIVTAYSLPTGFSVSSDAKRIIGYVNFTDTKTIKLELSDGSTYNIVLKPIFFKKKYTY